MKLDRILASILARGSLGRLILLVILGMILASYLLKSFSVENICRREAEKQVLELAKLSGLEDKKAIEKLIKEAVEKCIQERRK